jgi:hypothetical protein
MRWICTVFAPLRIETACFSICFESYQLAGVLDGATRWLTARFGESKVGCSIRSISAFGVALDVAAYEGVPDEFVLTVTADGRVRRCSVIWRKQE